MGIYLNSTNQSFQESLNSEIYVDKSMLIQETNKVINTKQKYVCISRPRRFGKSMTLEMLNAYYSCGNKSLNQFKNLKISNADTFKEHLNKYNTLHINMQEFLSSSDSVENMIKDIEDTLKYELLQQYPKLNYINKNNLTRIMQIIYLETKISFVVLIDEWDCVFRENKQHKVSQKKYLDFLRNLLKDKVYIALTYMTGILPIKKYGSHSALNMFTEISMINPRQYTEYTGFTEQEVEELCIKYNMDISQTKKWYDGYNIKGISLFNPRSVVLSMTGHDFDNYWTQTETYEALKVYICMNFDGLRDSIINLISGNSVKIDTGTFSNDMVTFNNQDDILTLLVHLGYLTYNISTQEVSIPNNEILKEFISVINISDWKEVSSAIKNSMDLLEATINCDEDLVATSIEKIHQENTSILQYNNENSLSCVITLAYYGAKEYYTIFRELPTGKGFANIVLIPNKNHLDKPAIVIELKFNDSVDTAIKQILRQEYTSSLKDYTGNILLVGVNYDKSTKIHTCKILKNTK